MTQISQIRQTQKKSMARQAVQGHVINRIFFIVFGVICVIWGLGPASKQFRFYGWFIFQLDYSDPIYGIL